MHVHANSKQRNKSVTWSTNLLLLLGCFFFFKVLSSIFFSSSLVAAEILCYTIRDLWPFLSGNSVNLEKLEINRKQFHRSLRVEYLSLRYGIKEHDLDSLWKELCVSKCMCVFSSPRPCVRACMSGYSTREGEMGAASPTTTLSVSLNDPWKLVRGHVIFEQPSLI